MKRYIFFSLVSGLSFAFLALLIPGRPTGSASAGLPDAVPGSIQPAPDAISLTLILVPSGDAATIATAGEQLAALLSNETGYQVYAQISSSYGAAVDALGTGNAELGFLPSQAYVVAHDIYGVQAKLVSVRFGQTYYRGQIIARTDSGIDTLSDLAGRNFAFTDPLSSSGYVFPAYHISKTVGVKYDDFLGQVVFTGNHFDAVRAVYYGVYDSTPIHAGASFEDARSTLLGEIPDIFTQTKVISYTDPIPNDAFCVRFGLDPLVTDHVINALLTIADTQEGDTILNELYGASEFQPVDDSAYDIVRQALGSFTLNYSSWPQEVIITSGTPGTLVYTGTQGLTTSVNLPPDLVDESTRISFGTLPGLTYTPENLVSIGHNFELSAVDVATNQSVLSLNRTYTISVEYNLTELLGTGQDSLGLYSWNGTTWEKEPSSQVDIETRQVMATPDHFSLWAVLGERRYPIFLPVVVRNP